MTNESREYPQSPDAEKGIIASVLLNPIEMIPWAANNGVSAEMFYVPAHAEIWDAITSLSASGAKVEFISIAQFLKDKGHLERVGGAYALNELFIYLSTSANALYYVELCREKMIARKFIKVCTDAISATYNANGTPVENVASLSAELLKIVSSRGRARQSTKEIIRDVCTEVITGKSDAGWMPTGIEPIDAELRLMRSDYVVMPGPTSSGKSALCAQFALAYAKQGMRVLYIPLEMSSRQVIKRAIAAESGWNAEALRAMVIRGSEFASFDAGVKKATEAFANAAHEIAQMDLTVIDDVYDLDAILATARAHASAKPLDVLCVDYPALMSMRGSYERRQLALAHASRSFKQFASEINGLVITPSQVNKDGGTREAADFENDANAILSVRFDESDEQKRNVIVGKQRDGARGQTLRLEWHGQTTSFKPIAK